MLNKLLEEEKIRNEKIKAPNNMEDKLRRGLDRIDTRDKTKVKKKVKLSQVSLVLLVGLVIIGINSNSIAGYINSINSQVREKLIEDFSEITPPNIKNVINEDHFQEINKEVKFPDGSRICVEGIIVDDVNLLVFMNTDKNNVFNDDYIDLAGVSNKGRTFHGGGVTEEVGSIGNYKMIRFINIDLKGDKITLNFLRKNKDYEELKKLDVKIDEGKKIKEVGKIKINHLFKNNDIKYRFKEIAITPINIRIDEYNENAIERIFNRLSSKIKTINQDEDLLVKLKVNGKEIESRSVNMTSTLSGSNFRIYYDYLGEDFDKIEDIKIEMYSIKNKKAMEVIDLDIGK